MGVYILTSNIIHSSISYVIYNFSQQKIVKKMATYRIIQVLKPQKVVIF